MNNTNTDHIDSKEEEKQEEKKENNTNIERIESKEEEKENNGNCFGMDVAEIDAVIDISNEKCDIDIKLKSLCDHHMQQQQKIMQQFVANSLRLMHEFNNNIYPLHNTLKTLKQRLQNVLLNEFLSIPCSYLDDMAKKQQTKSWGISPQYNDYNHTNCISQKYINLGINAADENDNDNNNKNDIISQYLSNTNNITAFQQDIILNFFTKAREEQKQREILAAQKIKQLQREKEAKKQREQRRADGAAILVSIFPFLSLEDAVIVMQINADEIEHASDYCMNRDHEQITSAINEWKERGEVCINNVNDRSCMDMTVLNRSQSTGETKCVIFKCIDINDDAILVLQAVLDRNHIPLDNKTAKLLYISIEDIMSYNGIKFESSERVKIAQNENVVCIIFQCIDNEDFFPIQFSPKCRDLEYLLKFDNEFEYNSDVCNDSLISVSHRMDGNVLFNGIYDDRDEVGIVGDGINDPIEIYSEIIDDVTHNIICIIFENDLRDNICIDVKNISFIEQTLEEVINDSKNDFIESDAVGNKIAYRIIVENEKIIAILTKIGNEIKQMPFIEHSWLKKGELISIPSQNILGIISCIPTGLIITNDPNKNIEKNEIEYTKNINSKICKKHCADLHGFIDIDIIPNQLQSNVVTNIFCKQSFVVTDIKRSTDNDNEKYIMYKKEKQKNIVNEINNLMKDIENNLNLIKHNDNNKISSKELLNTATNNVKKIQEFISCFIDEFGKENENKFVKLVNENIERYNREIRALRFEVRMLS